MVCQFSFLQVPFLKAWSQTLTGSGDIHSLTLILLARCLTTLTGMASLLTMLTPLRKIGGHDSYKSWSCPSLNSHWSRRRICPGLRRRRRNSLFRAAKKCKSSAAYQKYKAARNKVVALLHLNKNRFFRRLGSATSKEFWKAIKILNKQESFIPTLDNNVEKADSSCDKVDLLNTFLRVLDNHHLYLNPSNFPEGLQCSETCHFILIIIVPSIFSKH